MDLAARLHRRGELAFGVQAQETHTACWAAVAASVAVHRGEPISQQEIAARLETPLHERARVDEALDCIGALSRVTPGRAGLDELCTEIDAGRPLVAVLEWTGGGVHFVTIHGYELRERRTLLLLGDPRIGNTYHLERDFPRNYGRGGRWTWTCWLT